MPCPEASQQQQQQDKQSEKVDDAVVKDESRQDEELSRQESILHETLKAVEASVHPSASSAQAPMLPVNEESYISSHHGQVQSPEHYEARYPHPGLSMHPPPVQVGS